MADPRSYRQTEDKSNCKCIRRESRLQSSRRNWSEAWLYHRSADFDETCIRFSVYGGGFARPNGKRRANANSSLLTYAPPIRYFPFRAIREAFGFSRNYSKIVNHRRFSSGFPRRSIIRSSSFYALLSPPPPCGSFDFLFSRSIYTSGVFIPIVRRSIVLRLMNRSACYFIAKMGKYDQMERNC